MALRAGVVGPHQSPEIINLEVCPLVPRPKFGRTVPALANAVVFHHICRYGSLYHFRNPASKTMTKKLSWTRLTSRLAACSQPAVDQDHTSVKVLCLDNGRVQRVLNSAVALGKALLAVKSRPYMCEPYRFRRMLT